MKQINQLLVAEKLLKQSYTYFLEDKESFISKVQELSHVIENAGTEVDDSLIPRFTKAEVLSLHRDGGFTVENYIDLLEILGIEE